ncbi:hypothetical protein J5N97_005812 [Dioscorea zingiberensis]|uniref:Uncharacterized protein n=1 Tax=Dioscorea zingiberensis TaxID=325984 RepID=A0A9D5D8Q1_9LILI|nr:hypothetical protein J5N97_005812 [Dioscorea zingiberensis]
MVIGLSPRWPMKSTILPHICPLNLGGIELCSDFQALSDQFYQSPEHHKFVRQQFINQEWSENLVSRNIDLVYGGGSVGLMVLISQAVYDEGMLLGYLDMVL